MGKRRGLLKPYWIGLDPIDLLHLWNFVQNFATNKLRRVLDMTYSRHMIPEVLARIITYLEVEKLLIAIVPNSVVVVVFRALKINHNRLFNMHSIHHAGLRWRRLPMDYQSAARRDLRTT